MLQQHRRDFTAIYKCEHCKHEIQSNGYDDTNFHKNVIPNFKCEKCGKKAPSSYTPQGTKYPDGVQI